MNQLKEMLEAYRNGERGLPTYDELAAIAEEEDELNKRDYFAAQSLTNTAFEVCNFKHEDMDHAAKSYAKAAYMVADAMLSERAK